MARKKIEWTDEIDNEIIKLIGEGKSNESIGKELGYGRDTIRRRCKQLGIKSKYYEKNFPKNFCKYCGEEIIGEDRRRKKFCNHSCAAKFNNKGVVRNGKPVIKYEFCIICGEKTKENASKYCSAKCFHEHKYRKYIKRWKNGEEDGMSGSDSLSAYIRRYIFEKYDNKCCECGWSVVNEYAGKIPLEIDHIDGDHKNNKEENLRLLCPNCHSLTPNYGSRNKGKGREGRQKYRNQNKLIDEFIKSLGIDIAD